MMNVDEKFNFYTKRERELFEKHSRNFLMNEFDGFEIFLFDDKDRCFCDGVIKYRCKYFPFEIKVRDSHYNRLYLQCDKIDRFAEMKEKNISDIKSHFPNDEVLFFPVYLHISFTPEGIFYYFFDVRQKHHLLINEREANYSTAHSRDYKVKKRFYSLPTSSEWMTEDEKKCIKRYNFFKKRLHFETL